MARRRRHDDEEHENHERWLVSYADFITLLFAFFVVMYAISTLNEGKYRVLSEALVSAFRHDKVVHPPATGPQHAAPSTGSSPASSSPMGTSLRTRTPTAPRTRTTSSWTRRPISPSNV